MDEVFKSKVSEDIIHQIFQRLPLKSLLRFRSISVNCCHIIDSLCFANMHMISTRDIAAEEHELLSLYSGENCENVEHPYIYDGTEIRKNDHPIMVFSRKDHDYAIETVAYGLFLFRNLKCVGEVFLYNPLRGEILELPQPLGALTGNHLTKEVLAEYGIGFDSRIGSYKIVRMCKKPMGIDNMLDRLRFETEVYTLGTSSWRVISSSVSFLLVDDFCFSWEGDDSKIIRGVSAYGDMHWKCWDSKRKEQRIMSFDFKKERFKDAPLPNTGWQHRPCRQQLINLNGFLAVFSFPIEDECIDIWALKDYEKKEWVREYRIVAHQLFTSAPTNNVAIHGSDICLWRNLITPVGVCGQGGVVFESLVRLFVLDLKTNQILGMERPQSYISHTRKLSYIGNILCLGNFGHLIAEYSPKYNFLKTGRRVYVAT